MEKLPGADRKAVREAVRRREGRGDEPLSFVEAAQNIVDDVAALEARYAAAERLLRERDEAKAAQLATEQAQQVEADNQRLLSRLDAIGPEYTAADVAVEQSLGHVRAAENALQEAKRIHADAFARRVQLNNERSQIIDKLKQRGVLPQFDEETRNAQLKRQKWLELLKFGRTSTS